MILGIDASTSIVGWAFFNGIEVVDAGFINIAKFDTNKEKTLHVISVLETNANLPLVSHINLEAALSGFMGGRTSQQTIIKLARFNAVFEYIISEKMNIKVNLIGAMTARKKVFGKARIKGMTGKEYVRNQIDAKFAYVHKFDKLNNKQAWDAHNEVTYDAIVMSMA